LEREKSHPFQKSQINGRLKYQTEAGSTKKWVSPVVQVEPNQQPTAASRDSRSSSCSNHSSGPVEASSYEYPVPVVRRQQIGIEEQLFSRGVLAGKGGRGLESNPRVQQGSKNVLKLASLLST
ncbi:hypothetical protein TIFTF001_055948, partial [Ficus carica]